METAYKIPSPRNMVAMDWECSDCGQCIADDDVYCSNCGKKLMETQRNDP